MSETIINGIDVSECGFYCWTHNGNELIENYCAVFNNRCICNPDCYFKQLRRLQEENKRLQMLSCANCGEKYLSPEGAELYNKMRDCKDALEEIRKAIGEKYGLADIIKIRTILDEVLNDRD